MLNKPKRTTFALKLAVTLIWATGVTILGLQGCQSGGTGQPAAADSGGAAPPGKVLGIFPPPPDTSGAELWAANCNRCHNAQPPQRFSSAQWSTIVHHMRLRADLTGEEARKITEFLQASN
jgi:hypothetical protein